MRLLSILVVGGGPTGVEFCGELGDFIRSVRPSCDPHPYPRPNKEPHGWRWPDRRGVLVEFYSDLGDMICSLRLPRLQGFHSPISEGWPGAGSSVQRAAC